MKALIIGRAFGVWSEVAAAQAMTDYFDAILCINISGVDFPDHFDHWVSFHPEHYQRWIRERIAKGHPGGFKLWTAQHRDVQLGLHLGLPLSHVPCAGGSSGFLAVRVALEALGATHVICCGIPLEATARYDDSSPWHEHLVYRGLWESEKPSLLGKVKSMSGWTADLLGKPDREWLHGKAAA